MQKAWKALYLRALARIISKKVVRWLSIWGGVAKILEWPNVSVILFAVLTIFKSTIIIVYAMIRVQKYNFILSYERLVR